MDQESGRMEIDDGRCDDLLYGCGYRIRPRVPRKSHNRWREVARHSGLGGMVGVISAFAITSFAFRIRMLPKLKSLCRNQKAGRSQETLFALERRFENRGVGIVVIAASTEILKSHQAPYVTPRLLRNCNSWMIEDL